MNTLRLFRQTELIVQVRPNDFDRLGHVNNAVVLEYLELGRWRWLESHNLGTDGDIIPVVAKAEIQYRHQIRSLEATVTTQVKNPEHLLDLEDLSYQAIFHQEIYTHESALKQLTVVSKIQVAFIQLRTFQLKTAQDYLSQSRTYAKT